LGDAFLANKSYTDTTAAYGAALRLATQSRDRPNQFRAIDGLVTAHSGAGRYDRAFDLLQQRLSIAQSLQSSQQLLISFRSLAQLYEQFGNSSAARTYYQQAIAMARELRDTKQEALLINQLSRIPQSRAGKS
jgi:tetratricopeptide (TPR) repeat protein